MRQQAMMWNYGTLTYSSAAASNGVAPRYPDSP